MAQLTAEVKEAITKQISKEVAFPVATSSPDQTPNVAYITYLTSISWHWLNCCETLFHESHTDRVLGAKLLNKFRYLSDFRDKLAGQKPLSDIDRNMRKI